MSKILVIVESPAKCKKIENYLGSSYKCIASFGHIRELVTKKGLDCIDIKHNYSPIYQNCISKLKQINVIKREIAKCSDVLLATDDDREGEAIAWHICKVAGLDPLHTKRIIFHEITKSALQKAVLNPGRINMDMVNSQKARQVLDLLVGFTISPVLWKHISQNKKSALSAGRCQTPALRLVYDNENDIKENPGKKCYGITGYFTDKNIKYLLTDVLDTSSDCETFLEKSVYHSHMMVNTKPKRIEKEQPKPLTTSDIQQKASSVLNSSPKQTMSMCQKLYECGYITYMRTDSRFYSKEFIESTKKYIIETFNDTYVRKDLFTLSLDAQSKIVTKKQKNDKDNSHAQEAHEAIRPTNITLLEVKPDGEKITHKEAKLYALIWSITIESCMSKSEYMRFLSTITSPYKCLYKKTLEQNVFPGWEIIRGYEEDNPEYHYLLALRTKNSISYYKIKGTYNLKEVKTRYNEAKLVRILEKKGIGRPSTFASIISKIEERGYVKKGDVKGETIDCIDYELTGDEIHEIEHKKVVGGEKNKMILQPIGKIVIEFLLHNYNTIFDYDYTKKMEDTLDMIANGKKKWYSICDECYKDITKINNSLQINESDKKTTLEGGYSYRIARYGPVLMKTINGKIKYFKIKPGISEDDIKNGIIKPEDAILNHTKNTSFGTYNEKEIILKKGKFGLYVSYNGKNISLKDLNKNENEITLSDIIPLIECKTNNILRTINETSSIRNGKYGHYIYYKAKGMKKPKFIKLCKETIDYMNCSNEELEDYIDTQV